MCFEARDAEDEVAITVGGERLAAPGHPATEIRKLPFVMLSRAAGSTIAEMLQEPSVQRALVLRPPPPLCNCTPDAIVHAN